MLSVFPSPMTMVKPHEKKSQNYFRVSTITRNNIVICHRNANFQKMDNERPTGKNDFFQFL